MQYETVIGLEVHAQLLTNSKIFCACPTQFGKEPNANTCPVCLGLPGALPVLNKRAVEYAIRAGLAVNATIAEHSVFARKNYFYPDLPKGYQISQFELPLCQEGYLDIDTATGRKRIGIERIHMEEDAGKLMHEHPDSRSQSASWVDLNRAGVPLIEIVSKPDLRSADEAIAYLKKLRSVVRYLEICDGNLEEGSMRCDANVSIRPVGESKLGTRAEIKNLNSFKNVEKAIHHEVARQSEVLEAGGKVVQETRLWDTDLAQTQSMRSKEESSDYRYFPDPDLLNLAVAPAWMEEIRSQLPELQEQKVERFCSDYGLSPTDAAIVTQSKELAQFFEDTVAIYPDPKKISNWILSELLRELNRAGQEINETRLTPAHLADLLKCIDDGTISGKTAKDVFAKVFASGKKPQEIIKAEGLRQVSDTGSLEPIIDEVVAAHPDEVEKFRGGKTGLMGFFVGQVMKKTQGQANPKLVNELLKKKLG